LADGHHGVKTAHAFHSVKLWVNEKEIGFNKDE
jgi:hypothetical protein